MRTRNRTLRRAVAASVGIHLVLAIGVVGVGRWGTPRPDRAAATDPGPPDVVRFTTDALDEPAVDVAAVPASPAPHAVEPVRPPEPAPPTGRPPTVPHVPRVLPPELLARLRRPAPEPVGGPVVEVALTPTAARPTPPAPAGVRPAGHAEAGTAAAADDGSAGAPVHGPLGPGQTVVYVLDTSGSMGEWGKLAAAKRALVATLRRQPPTVRFQVVVYAGRGRVLLPAPVGGCVAATAENAERIAGALRAVEPAGRSDHADGLRTALALRPDFVVVFTDADDLTAARVRGVLAGAARPAVVCVAAVGPSGVGPPAPLR